MHLPRGDHVDGVDFLQHLSPTWAFSAILCLDSSFWVLGTVHGGQTFEAHFKMLRKCDRYLLSKCQYGL